MYRWLLVVVLVVRPQCPPSVLPPLSLSKTALVKFKHPTVEAANFFYAIKFQVNISCYVLRVAADAL